jgi:hypothetical protein
MQVKTMTEMRRLLYHTSLKKSSLAGGSWLDSNRRASYCQLIVLRSRSKLELSIPKGTHSLRLCVIFSSYTSADHAIVLSPIEVGKGEDSSDKDSEEDDGDVIEE